MSTLSEVFSLEVISPYHYRGKSRQNAWPRVFGGVFLAQTILSAYKALEELGIFGQNIHSLHGYFLQAGATEGGFDYQVNCLRKGKSFTLFHVSVFSTEQKERGVLFCAMLSFQKQEQGLYHIERDHNIAMLTPPDFAQESLLGEKACMLTKHYWQLQSPFLFAPTDPKNYHERNIPKALNRNWFYLSRQKEFKILTKAQCAALLAYMSDMTILDNALTLYGESIFTQRMQTGSLDHAIWFHNVLQDEQNIFESPLLYQIETPATGGNRAFNLGKIYSPDGKLLVSCAQEGLMRQKMKE